MKNAIMLSAVLLLAVLTQCKKNDPDAQADTVKGDRATIAWKDCAYFSDHGLTVCFVDASEYRCPCDVECVWEGAVDATLHVTGPGVDTTITLTTNSSPGALHQSARVGARLIRFVETNHFDCADYAHYNKYKVVVEISS